MKNIIVSFLFLTLLLCSCHSEKSEQTHTSGVTAEMALEGVSNYCHSEYDWSVADENPDLMSVTMGEETETEYKVVFRSYTGALVNFYVDKSSGLTRKVEYVPALDLESEAGTINLFDYIEKESKAAMPKE